MIGEMSSRTANKLQKAVAAKKTALTKKRKRMLNREMRAVPAKSCSAHDGSELQRRVRAASDKKSRFSPCEQRHGIEGGNQQVFFDIVAHELRKRLTPHSL